MASTVHLFGEQYHLVRRKNGGQYAGPCPISGGTDRFVVEPATRKWLCRECRATCTVGRASRRSGFRFGSFKEIDPATASFSAAPPAEEQRKVTLKNHIVYAELLHDNITPRMREYLEGRGVKEESIKHFKLGSYTGRAITIPLIYKKGDKTFCQAIKRRWLPEFKGGKPSYQAMKGHSIIGLFNRDVLDEPGRYMIVANSLMDAMFLWELGFRVVASYAGENSWDRAWSKLFKVELVLNLQDHDKKDQFGKRPGEYYAKQRAIKLASASGLKRILTVKPPGELSDVGAMYDSGIDVREWIKEIIDK